MPRNMTETPDTIVGFGTNTVTSLARRRKKHLFIVYYYELNPGEAEGGGQLGVPARHGPPR